MIIINEKFSTERDKYQWLLHEEKEGLSKEGLAITVKNTSYHSNLKQVCQEVMNRELGACQSVKQTEDALALFESKLDEIFGDKK